MQIEFQKEVLKFLLQTREGRKFLDLVDSSIFDLPVHQIILSLIQDYVKEYKVNPSRPNLLQFWRVQIKKSKEPISKEVSNEVDATIRQAYDELVSETGQIKDVLLDLVKIKKTKLIMTDYAPKINDGTQAIENLHKELTKITNLSIEDSVEEGGFIIRDHKEDTWDFQEGHPTFIHGLNRMTAARGFKAPDMHVFMGRFKGFKTGTMICLASEFVRDGLNGFYADTENGKRAVTNRIKQHYMELTRSEIRLPENRGKLSDIIKRVGVMRGDLMPHFFPPLTKTMDDVQFEIDKLWDEFGWKPDFIVFDDLDKFKPIKDKRSDKRIEINDVYLNALALLEKNNCFGLVPAQVVRGSVDKEFYTEKDMGEDIKKIANAHAVWGLPRTEQEMTDGIMRIHPVAQREGLNAQRAGFVIMKVDEERQTMEEVNMEMALKLLKRKRTEEI